MRLVDTSDIRNLLDKRCIDLLSCRKQWEISQLIAAMNLLVELDVLEAIPKQGSITSKDLAEIVKVDESAICKSSLTITLRDEILTIFQHVR